MKKKNVEDIEAVEPVNEVKSAMVTTNLNIREYPSMESEILGILHKGSLIKYSDVVMGGDGYEYVSLDQGYCQKRFLA